ncbi:MAG: hypothetical protein ABIF88_00010 [archaeon]
MELETLMKILIGVVFLIIAVWIIVYLLQGKGGSLISAIKNTWRF